MREANTLVSRTLGEIAKWVAPGVTTQKLDTIAKEFILDNGGRPACLGYGGFPGSICAEVNEVVVHGIPNKNKKLKNGDIITIDVVIGYKGYQGDAAWTYAVGEIDDDKKYLMEHTEKALYEGIKQARAGNHVGDISYAVQKYAEDHNLGVVRELCGHGVGTDVHEDPEVPNYGEAGTGPKLREGMVIAIEPMLTMGSPKVFLRENNWTVETQDGSLAGHYEHTIVVTKDGYEILTGEIKNG